MGLLLFNTTTECAEVVFAGNAAQLLLNKCTAGEVFFLSFFGTGWTRSPPPTHSVEKLRNTLRETESAKASARCTHRKAGDCQIDEASLPEPEALYLKDLPSVTIDTQIVNHPAGRLQRGQPTYCCDEHCLLH